MRRARHWQGGPQWWPEGEHWPPPGGRGYETWAAFGRRMFVGVVLFLVAIVLMAVLVGALVATWLAGVTSSNRVAVVVATVAALVVGVWLVQLVVRTTYRPVRDLTRAAGRLADGDYTARVDGGSTPWVRGVVSSFNSMADRLERSDEQRRQLMSDLSHELRTPLAVIRGELEAVVDGVRDGGADHSESLLDEVEVMERLVEDLRILTLSEAGRLPLHRETVDLAGIVQEVGDSYLPLAASSGIDVTVDLPTDAPAMELDPVRIRQALTNLVVNSIRAMPTGGMLTIRVEEHADRTQVVVVDTGSGIDPEQLPHVFGRFVKSADSEGSGLGLSIARGLVRAHGGDLEITGSGPTGTIATMWLPR